VKRVQVLLVATFMSLSPLVALAQQAMPGTQVPYPARAFTPAHGDLARSRGGFWSLTMYDKDYFMLPRSPNGRTNIGTVNLDANELKFASDGSLTITMSREQPADAEARANWLPAPEGQFALIVRAYVPMQPILDGSYKWPNVQRQ
jgi:Protein of unknown function (DUF1214)